jgi:hypothetical protein
MKEDGIMPAEGQKIGATSNYAAPCPEVFEIFQA